jgi:hypothetical protein
MMDPKPLSCSNWEEQLASVDENDLSPLEREALDQHIASCPSCAVLREEYAAMRCLIRGLPVTGPQPEFPQKLRRLWEAEVSSDSFPERGVALDSGSEHLEKESSVGNRSGSRGKQKKRHSMPYRQTISLTLVGMGLFALSMLLILLTTVSANSLNVLLMTTLIVIVAFFSCVLALLGSILGISTIRDRIHMQSVQRELRGLECRIMKHRATVTSNPDQGTVTISNQTRRNGKFARL